MSKNIEIKARLTDPSTTAALAAMISDSTPQCLRQVDTFFGISYGRLKLRIISEKSTKIAELIYYKRNNSLGPKKSDYRRIPIKMPWVTNMVLSLLLGTRGKIIKDRLVYLVDHTRIHIDHVQSLGDFIELEVVLLQNQSEDEGINKAWRLMHDLHISEEDLVDGSYIDLLTRHTDSPEKAHFSNLQ